MTICIQNIEKVIITGINPHAGESGLIGSEDSVIKKSINELRKRNPKIKFSGPISGDSMHAELKDSKKELQVFCHHDQALSYFKFKNGIIGINTTFGLNFLRLSVDHGTALGLYGKNEANPLGSYFVLTEAIKIHEKIRL